MHTIPQNTSSSQAIFDFCVKINPDLEDFRWCRQQWRVPLEQDFGPPPYPPDVEKDWVYTDPDEPELGSWQSDLAELTEAYSEFTPDSLKHLEAYFKTVVPPETPKMPSPSTLLQEAKQYTAKAKTASPDIPALLASIQSAQAIMAKPYQQVKWAVPGLIPEGLTLLAGRPKMGKSWLALHLALAVAHGGLVLGQIPVSQKDALYLALEDSEGRMHRRLDRMLGDNEPSPAALNLIDHWLQTNEGAADAIQAWINATPNAGLIVIDTLARIRSPRATKDVYQEDYQAVLPYQKLAQKNGIAVVIVDHTRKPKGMGDNDDFLDDVQGSSGKTAAADAVMVLKRPRHSRDGTLCVTSRESEEVELSLRFDPEYCLWQQLDPAKAKEPDYGLPEKKQKVRKYLKEKGEQGKMALVTLLGGNVETTAKYIERMAADKWILRTTKGTYIHPDMHSAQ